jgi:hypothetical protein
MAPKLRLVTLQSGDPTRAMCDWATEEGLAQLYFYPVATPIREQFCPNVFGLASDTELTRDQADRVLKRAASFENRTSPSARWRAALPKATPHADFGSRAAHHHR